MKEIYSSNYGTNPKEGLHNWLLLNIEGYKRSKMQLYIIGFAKFINKPHKKDSVALCSGNFKKWVEFVKFKTKTK